MSLLEEAYHSGTLGRQLCAPSLGDNPDSATIALRSLRQIVPELPYNLIRGYLPDMRLDVTDLMRCAK